MTNWSNLRKTARRTVHATFGEPFPYVGPDGGAAIDLLVRHRTRQTIHGPGDSELVDIVEGVNRLVFSAEDLAAKQVTLERGGRVTVPPFVLELDQQENLTGPIEVPWSVVNVTAES